MLNTDANILTDTPPRYFTMLIRVFVADIGIIILPSLRGSAVLI